MVVYSVPSKPVESTPPRKVSPCVGWFLPSKWCCNCIRSTPQFHTTNFVTLQPNEKLPCLFRRKSYVVIPGTAAGQVCSRIRGGPRKTAAEKPDSCLSGKDSVHHLAELFHRRKQGRRAVPLGGIPSYPSQKEWRESSNAWKIRGSETGAVSFLGWVLHGAGSGSGGGSTKNPPSRCMRFPPTGGRGGGNHKNRFLLATPRKAYRTPSVRHLRT